MMPCSAAIAAARAAFPRGLAQPDGAYRFGLDALLLAAWAADCLPAVPGAARQTFSPSGMPSDAPAASSGPGTGPARARTPCVRVAELGTGCGASLAGLALCRADICGTGFERAPILAETAAANFTTLGLCHRLAAVCMDIDTTVSGQYGRHDLVMANPPWRMAREGRLPGTALRRGALTDGLRDPALTFARAAAAMLRHHGRYCCIFSASGLPRLLAALTAAGLGLRRLRWVHALPDRPAHCLLAEARKGARDDVRVEAPLILHADAAAARQGIHAPAAATFCPWLR
ncbi:MAG: N-6 DNA methylase [Desulfovibrionaceae bacterium]|nr:N-6 DNA methylase [Desulfovibrionaceae bacterium]